MFTGLVQTVGVVRSIYPSPVGVRLAVNASDWPPDPEPGESISVAGVCLTLVVDGRTPGTLAFDAVPETLSKTTLGCLRPGDAVNLERSLRADSLMGGHFVQGHVDGVGVVERVRSDPSDWRLIVRPPAPLMEFMAPKGSITIDGVSLTIAELTRDSVEIALIPTTLERTTLGAMREGDHCNIEADVIAKTVVHWMRNFAQRPAP